MAENGKPKAKRAPRKAYKMPDKIASGEVLVDTAKVSWILGTSIGVGGFGEIYAAAKATEPKQMSYAVKIEPVENGPLFCERNIYINIGKKEDMEEFSKLRKLKYLAIPDFHGFGSHTYKKSTYRFIVIQKLGLDVYHQLKIGKIMSYPTILKIGIHVLNVLEYMHGKGYVHCDVKASNLLLGESKATEKQIYLVDFGLACKFATTATPNPKKAHNGTLEFTSRDAHQGVMTRRGDVEILAYNLLQWAGGELPWKSQKDPPDVKELKEEWMEKPEALVEFCYKKKTPDAAIKGFLKMVCQMKPLDEPNYKQLGDILNADLKKLKSDINQIEICYPHELEPKLKATAASVKRQPKKAKSSVSEDENSKPVRKRVAATKRKVVQADDDENISLDEDTKPLVQKRVATPKKKVLQPAVEEDVESSSLDENTKPLVKKRVAASKKKVVAPAIEDDVGNSSLDEDTKPLVQKVAASKKKVVPPAAEDDVENRSLHEDTKSLAKKRVAASKKKVVASVDDNSADGSSLDEDTKPLVQKRVAASKNMVVESFDEEDLFHDEDTKPVARKRVVKKKMGAAASMDDVRVDNQEKKSRGGTRKLKRVHSDTNLNVDGASDASRRSPRSRTAKKKADAGQPIKKSWRDCPTIANGARGGDQPPNKLGKL